METDNRTKKKKISRLRRKTEENEKNLEKQAKNRTDAALAQDRVRILLYIADITSCTGSNSFEADKERAGETGRTGGEASENRGGDREQREIRG